MVFNPSIVLLIFAFIKNATIVTKYTKCGNNGSWIHD